MNEIEDNELLLVALLAELTSFGEKLRKSQRDLEPEQVQILRRHVWDLYDDTPLWKREKP